MKYALKMSYVLENRQIAAVVSGTSPTHFLSSRFKQFLREHSAVSKTSWVLKWARNVRICASFSICYPLCFLSFWIKHKYVEGGRTIPFSLKKLSRNNVHQILFTQVQWKCNKKEAAICLFSSLWVQYVCACLHVCECMLWMQICRCYHSIRHIFSREWLLNSRRAPG